MLTVCSIARELSDLLFTAEAPLFNAAILHVETDKQALQDIRAAYTTDQFTLRRSLPGLEHCDGFFIAD